MAARARPGPLATSPYGDGPKGVRTYKSRISEEREYAKLLSAAIQPAAAPKLLSSAVWKPVEGTQQPPQQLQRPWSRSPW